MRILVGIDGSKHSQNALIEAIKLAKQFSGFVKVITVYSKGKVQEATRNLEEAEKILRKEGVVHETMPILGSNPSRALINVSLHEDFDLIVVGSRGLGSAASFLLGSVSIEVAVKASSDVLIIKK